MRNFQDLYNKSAIVGRAVTIILRILKESDQIIIFFYFAPSHSLPMILLLAVFNLHLYFVNRRSIAEEVNERFKWTELVNTILPIQYQPVFYPHSGLRKKEEKLKNRANAVLAALIGVESDPTLIENE
jgi:hypothetical protein